MATPRFCLIALLLMGVSRPDAFAQPTRPVRAEVSAVTVFRDRAQVTATARAVAERGSTEVLVGNLPAGLDPATVQVAATTDAADAALTLLGVEVRADYPAAAAPRAFATLQDSSRAYEAQVRSLTDQRDILQKEEAALLMAMGQGKVDSDELEDIAELYRTRATASRAQIQRIEARLARLGPQMERWQQQVNSYEGPRLTPPGQLAITLGSETRTTVMLTLTYVTTDAGWEPVYDLRATAAGTGPVQLVYKAAVRQSTGSDWRGVRLTLSGGAPAVGGGGGLPELQTAYVRVDDPGRAMRFAPPSAPMMEEESKAGFAEADAGSSEWGSGEIAQAVRIAAPAMPPPTTAGRDGSAIRFELTNPFTVPADGRPHTVEVQQAQLPATYGLTVVPKLEETAFLTAAITGWEQYNLLAGRANTYLDGTFTGAFVLDPARAVDTLRLTLGPDRNVVVRREKSREFSKRALFGGTVTDAVSYIVTAKNLRQQPTNLRVEEQVPRTADSRISVQATELSGARLDEATGRLVWQARLQPNETRAWKLAYEIKYPKKVAISVD
jgi:uncharacterized protein (TIGR02231 family)